MFSRAKLICCITHIRMYFQNRKAARTLLYYSIKYKKGNVALNYSSKKKKRIYIGK